MRNIDHTIVIGIKLLTLKLFWTFKVDNSLLQQIFDTTFERFTTTYKPAMWIFKSFLIFFTLSHPFLYFFYA